MDPLIAIQAQQLGKCFQLYDKPVDRLWQMLVPRTSARKDFWAVRDVALEVRRGETVGIIGRNGSGKSTLLQLLCDIVAPTTGSVQTHGRVAALLELGSGFNLEFTGRENVYLNAAMHGLARAQVDARFAEIEAFAGIGEFIDQPAKTYSSGMLMRLAFAVSVHVDPDILMIDEALAVGDASFQFKCLDRLEALTAGGTTLLFVSHDMGMVKRFCNRAIYIADGRVRASGAPDEIAERYLLDTRDDQRRWASSGTVGVAQKPALGPVGDFAFGTDEGRITDACFTNTQSALSSYVHGDLVQLRIGATFRASILHPSISVTIQEARLLVIGGANFPLNALPADAGWQVAMLSVRFRMQLAPGRYHVTLKLLNGHGEEASQLVEKQVGVLAFDVLPGDSQFVGIVDLGLEQVASARTEPAPHLQPQPAA